MARVWIGAHVRRWQIVALTLCVPVLLSACAVLGVQGSGDLVTETRDVGSFTRINVSGGANVDLTVDPSMSQSVSVTYDDNIIEFVITRVQGNTLLIETQGSFSITGGVRRFVTVVTDAIEVIETSGGADVAGRGMIDSYRLEASGGSDVDLLDLKASSVEIEASGGADVVVYASVSATGEASGGADVDIFGSPASFDVSRSGGADVNLRG